MLLGARTAMWGGKRLPYKKRLEYIENNGVWGTVGEGPYIETSVLPVNNPIVEVSIQPLSFEKYQWICGCRRFNSPAVRFDIGINDSTGYPRAVYSNGTARNASVSISTDGFSRLVMTKTSLSMNDNVLVSYSQTIGNQLTNGPRFTLFHLLQTGGLANRDRGFGGRMAYCKIWNDDGATLAGSFIPVLDWDDNPTMFDEVTQTYPTRYGTFVAGPEA